MRKHFYLITEHENPDRVGGVSIHDSRRAKPEKNEEGDIHLFNKESGEFRTAGKYVHFGYADFEDEAEYEETVSDVMKEKLTEIDREWVEKAGIEDLIYGDSE